MIYIYMENFEPSCQNKNKDTIKMRHYNGEEIIRRSGSESTDLLKFLLNEIPEKLNIICITPKGKLV